VELPVISTFSSFQQITPETYHALTDSFVNRCAALIKAIDRENPVLQKSQPREAAKCNSLNHSYYFYPMAIETFGSPLHRHLWHLNRFADVRPTRNVLLFQRILAEILRFNAIREGRRLREVLL
jgi:hypothetical protein